MSSSRRPFTGPMPHTGTHGGVKSIHRFGIDGDWSHARTEDACLVAEMIYTGRKAVADFHCAHCDSIITLLRTHGGGTGPVGIGITHSPGCPWLLANADR